MKPYFLISIALALAYEYAGESIGGAQVHKIAQTTYSDYQQAEVPCRTFYVLPQELLAKLFIPIGNSPKMMGGG